MIKNKMKVVLVFIFMVISPILSERIVLLDLTPEEAQKYMANRGLELSYAKKLTTGSLTRDGKNYYQGRLIEHPEDYVEEEYEANQFHGQDGLGRAMFGYKDWNQGRLEARNANGEVRGSYQYVDPYGENIIVNYWSDSLGFHQTDNRAKNVLTAVTETPEVKAAREAHKKAWEAAARAAKEDPDPLSDVYNEKANRLDEAQAEQDQADEIISGVANQEQSLTRYPHIQKHVHPGKNSALGDEDTVVVESAAESRTTNKKVKAVEEDEEESTNEPRGFYYSYDYPVNLIVESSNLRKGKSLDQKAPSNFAQEAQATETKTLATKATVTSEKNSKEEIVPRVAAKTVIEEKPTQTTENSVTETEKSEVSTSSTTEAAKSTSTTPKSSESTSTTTKVETTEKATKASS